jgi:hypothetical protein
VTRKDYQRFAEVFRAAKANNYLTPDIFIWLTKEVADIFSNDNSRFSREKFYQACEPTKGKKL